MCNGFVHDSVVNVVDTITAVRVCGCDKQPLATRFTPAATSAATFELMEEVVKEKDVGAAGMKERCEEEEEERETSKLVSFDHTSMRVSKFF